MRSRTNKYLFLSVAIYSVVAVGYSSLAAKTVRGVSSPDGPAVGFAQSDFTDARRAFDSWSGETQRPLRAYFWYPSNDSSPAAGSSMTMADYYLASSDLGFVGESVLGDPLQSRRELLGRRHSLTAEEIEEVLDTQFDAVHQAPRSPGTFPLVILFADPHSLASIAESLAGAGYVVVAPSRIGTHSRNPLQFRPNARSLDTDVDDLRFLYQQLQELDWIDSDRLGICAFSSGSLSILLWQMQDLRAKAIVTLEGWEGFEKGVGVLERSIDYRPRSVRVPWLRIDKAAEESNSNYAKTKAVVDAMPFAAYERLRFGLAEHMSFLTETRTIAVVRGNSDGIGLHDAAVAGIMDFFGRSLGGQQTQVPTSSHFVRTVRPQIPPVPTQEELVRMLERGELEKARAAVLASPRDPGVAFERSVMRRVASQVSDPDSKLDAYLWIAEVHPQSARAWIDIGDTHASRGKTLREEEALKRALALLPRDGSLDRDARLGLSIEVEARLKSLADSTTDP